MPNWRTIRPPFRRPQRRRLAVHAGVERHLNTNYEWAVGSGSMAYVGGSVRYLSDQSASYDAAFRAANGRQREVESYEVLDLQAGVDFGRFSIELYGKNLTEATARLRLARSAPRRWARRNRRDPAAHFRVDVGFSF